MKGKKRVLTLEKDQLIFRFLINGEMQDEVVLNAGYQHIVDTFFKGNIPSEAEIEYAINHIEDELMSRRQLVNENEELVNQSAVVKEVLRRFGLDKEVVQRDELEDMFRSVARRLINKYSPEDLETDPVSFAIILLLREITHHLKFERFVVSGF